MQSAYSLLIILRKVYLPSGSIHRKMGNIFAFSLNFPRITFHFNLLMHLKIFVLELILIKIKVKFVSLQEKKSSKLLLTQFNPTLVLIEPDLFIKYSNIGIIS